MRRSLPACSTSDSCCKRSSTTGTPAGVYLSAGTSMTVAVSSTRFTLGSPLPVSRLRCGRFRVRLTGLFALDRLHHDRCTARRFLGLDDEVAQDCVVIAERVLELVQHSLAALDIHAYVVSLDELLNGISQLAAAPILDTMDGAFAASDLGGIALDHGGHLLALIGMHDKHYFVVAHR